MAIPILTTPRLNLFALHERHFEPLVAMQLDAEVMQTIGGVWDRERTQRMFNRYVAAFARDGVSRFAVEDKDENFLGIAGVLRHSDVNVPPGRHDEIGWRFTRAAWGKGYASEASAATLHHAFAVTDCAEIWAYTTGDNARSQAVMARLGMPRDTAKDFELTTDSGRTWALKVWLARRG
ncbi:MAG: GNAT family N-acetyltransferase [Alphaproteobacteria bacterium]|nr:GNAT family N-acetyltransferase [Alphaproteobacteria bacterium]